MGRVGTTEGRGLNEFPLSLGFQSKWSLTNCHEAEWQGFLFLASATSQSNKFQVFITLPCKAERPFFVLK